MRENHVTEYNCLQACQLTPLAKLKSNQQHSIRDLLLSNMAAGPGITREQVITALDELINLKYPVINRILEIAAYFCFIKGLHIYCANPTEYSSLDLCGDDVGYFNPASGLIIVSTRIPLSQNLIHELTHAIRFFIGVSTNTALIRHTEFCAKKFPSFFSQAVNNNQLMEEEKQELKSIEADITAVRELSIEYSRHCSSQNWEKMMENTRKGSDIFDLRRRKVFAQQTFRREFYDCLKGYEKSDQAEEFLSKFLEHFVSAAHHKKIESLQTWVVKYMKETGEHANQSYYARVLQMMWNSLPKTLVSDFIMHDFRVALDNYAAMIPLTGQRLKDSVYYGATLAEPNRINNSYKHT